ncbi:DUF6463 family protein [Actinomadura sp. 9N407]|uniref:DUF6463 family protein n=1 Tax=Actinomadura sp. 9N407 TaxID=3375154 RepID=UPI0037ADEC5F
MTPDNKIRPTDAPESVPPIRTAEGGLANGTAPMNRMARWIPWGIIATAFIHTVYAFVTMSGAWGDIVDAGVFNGIEKDAEREAAVWFFYAGIGLLGFGTFALKEVRATGRIPLQIALYLVGIGGTMVVVLPDSGGWMLLVLGALTLVSRRGAADRR